MCGQLGFSSKENYDFEKIKILALWNSLERGQDSTGFYTPKNGVKKTLTRAAEVVVNPKFQMVKDNLMMGHFRWATVGNKVIDNAHPFKRGNFVLQHNGTLTNHLDLLDKYKLNWADYSVDSDVVCGAIEKCDDVAQVLKEINGPAAMIIHDTRIPNRLYVFKNKERPLYKGMIGANMYISSLEGPLLMIGCINIKEFKDDNLYTIEDGSIISTKAIKNVPYKKPLAVSSYNKPITGKYTNDIDIMHHMMRALGSWVRGAFSATFEKDFKMVKDDYYYVNAIVNAANITIYCPKQEKTLTTHVVNIQKDDIIVADDYCKILKDVRDVNNQVLMIKSGEIARCRTSYGDGELTLNDINTGQYITLTKKSMLRKLRADELINLLSTSVDNDDPCHDGACGPIEEIAPLKVASNEEVEELENDDYYDVWTNNKDLIAHFNKIDFRLTNLATICAKHGAGPEIMNRISSLVKCNLKGFESFTLPVDINAEESVEEESISK